MCPVMFLQAPSLQRRRATVSRASEGRCLGYYHHMQGNEEQVKQTTRKTPPRRAVTTLLN